jgi:hypothetical protein
VLIQLNHAFQYNFRDLNTPICLGEKPCPLRLSILLSWEAIRNGGYREKLPQRCALSLGLKFRTGARTQSLAGIQGVRYRPTWRGAHTGRPPSASLLRVPRTVGNRPNRYTNRSGSQSETVPIIFSSPPNRPVSPVYRQVFFGSWEPVCVVVGGGVWEPSRLPCRRLLPPPSAPELRRGGSARGRSHRTGAPPPSGPAPPTRCSSSPSRCPRPPRSPPPGPTSDTRELRRGGRPRAAPPAAHKQGRRQGQRSQHRVRKPSHAHALPMQSENP